MANDNEDSGPTMWFISACVAGIIAVTVIINKICQKCRRRYTHYDVPARDISKGHRWCKTEMFTQPTYCSVSKEHIIQGAYCDSCGICVDDGAVRVANRHIPCKVLSNKSDILKHHWVKGNLPLCSTCTVCQEECGHQAELCDMRCCWCQRTVHDQCLSKFTEICDLGHFRDFIVPPNCIQLKKVGIKGRRHLIVSTVTAPIIPKWQPLIVIANRKSGNNDGEHILRSFRAILNPAQVIDLHEISPQHGLEWCHLLPEVTCRVLVAGGDGTVGWVLDTIDNLKLKPAPQVCILPLGTGNDLSRVLGWGEGYTGDVVIKHILNQMKQSRVTHLDRWKVEISHEKRIGIPLPRKMKMMNNYASIGVDALVTLNFHRHRESRPSLFGSRLLNKFWYFTYGTKDVLERECKNLHTKLKVVLDGKELKLPEIEGLVILNISSWGGGCRPWGNSQGKFPTPRIDDGKFEVMGLYSSFHIAQLQVGLAEPLRLGQGHKVEITLSGGNAPMQVDGEPWEQHPADITITSNGQATMLEYAE
ncbi:unnamed protein product [Owenia fusiformis]|uniref:Diacylglycerol kinase n=1 Tax=Owenia fusiformis TaxID=6347 RepID=A0A8S4PML7_OWEFU|nr:unnamed protein product [Owenia fusiformis]